MEKNRQDSHLINHCPTSEGVSEVSGASERANGRAIDPVLQSVFLVDPDHSASVEPVNTTKSTHIHKE